MKDLIKKQVHEVFRDLTTFGGLIFYVLLLALVGVLGELTLFADLLAGFVILFAIVILIQTEFFKHEKTGVKHSLSSLWLSH